MTATIMDRLKQNYNRMESSLLPDTWFDIRFVGSTWWHLNAISAFLVFNQKDLFFEEYNNKESYSLNALGDNGPALVPYSKIKSIQVKPNTLLGIKLKSNHWSVICNYNRYVIGKHIEEPMKLNFQVDSENNKQGIFKTGDEVHNDFAQKMSQLKDKRNV